MPNHFHGILVIDKDAEEADGRGTARCAPTIRQFGKMIPESLPAIIRGFKAGVTRRINILRNIPGAQVWQRNFYEHVIRDENSLNRIRKYIINNPLSWDLDRENPERREEAGFYRWLCQFQQENVEAKLAVPCMDRIYLGTARPVSIIYPLAARRRSVTVGKYSIWVWGRKRAAMYWFMKPGVSESSKLVIISATRRSSTSSSREKASNVAP